jgi:hypothetical protein
VFTCPGGKSDGQRAVQDEAQRPWAAGWLSAACGNGRRRRCGTGAVSAMLEAAGEQQSPKYMPDMTAPAVSISFAPPERAMAMKDDAHGARNAEGGADGVGQQGAQGEGQHYEQRGVISFMP